MITCLIIGKDRVVNTVRIDPKKSNFTYNNGLYTLPKEAVNLTEFTDGKTESYPELIYVEGSPLPINDDSQDVSAFLDQTVIKNALKQTSKAPSDWMAIFKDYARNPNKLIIVLFIGIIGISFLWGLLGL